MSGSFDRLLPTLPLSTATALIVPEAGQRAVIRHLQHPALLFSKIAVFHLSGFLEFLVKSGSEGDLQLKTELEWLLGQDIVVPLEFGYFVDYFQEAAVHFPKIAPNALEYASAMSFAQTEWLNLPKWLGPNGVLFSSRSPHGLRSARHPAPFSGRMDVLRIVIAALPEPAEGTPWGQVLEFRADAAASHQVLALRRWISKIARENMSAVEISDEIEWLIAEYRAHMHLHRMKTGSGTLEAVVAAAGDILENLAKLKFGSLAKALFALRHRQVELLEAERQAPGRELAYIVRARERFGGKARGEHG
jgi:hypothetical protein